MNKIREAFNDYLISVVDCILDNTKRIKDYELDDAIGYIRSWATDTKKYEFPDELYEASYFSGLSEISFSNGQDWVDYVEEHRNEIIEVITNPFIFEYARAKNLALKRYRDKIEKLKEDLL